MKNSFLIQRLQKPLVSPNPIFDKIQNAFVFGGGLKNGGLSDEAMSLIKQLWAFDYMGSAEFEWGVIPKALNMMAQICDNFVCGSFLTPYKYHDFGRRDKPSKDYEGNGRVYYLCQKDHEEDVKKRISIWAVNPRSSDTKEIVMLDRTLSGCCTEHERPAVGWLELNNGYMFFTDEKMWRQTSRLFGVITPFKKTVSKQK
jgi:hypothetical protein